MNKKKVLSKLNPLFFEGIAHRGLHTQDGIPENSMEAFRNAIKHNVAIEFDVRITKDQIPVIFHDNNLKRMTGYDGMVEHLTLEELLKLKLPNGETIPLLEDFLKEVNEQVPMVLELKVEEKNYKVLSSIVREMLSRYIKDKSNMLIISFDPRALWPFKKDKYIRSLLVTSAKEYRYVYRFRHTVESVDLDYYFFLGKDSRKYRKYVKHHFVNAWTIDDMEKLGFVHPYVDTVTFQYIDVNKVREVLQFSRELKKK